MPARVGVCLSPSRLARRLFGLPSVVRNMNQDDPADWQDRRPDKMLEEKLARCKRELARARQDLEEFAYAVSHDLREPLRMVCSYLQLIERRCVAVLGEEERDFLGYASEGARRLQAMLDGLLEYSRVSTRGQQLQVTDAGEALSLAIASLESLIRQTGALITYDPMPTVRADPEQLVRVFRNLLENSLKFRGPDPPRIHVSARRHDGEWVFTVADNGTGIDPKSHERVFVVFQRAHGREYEGIGIGLAICKRIVERHGGRIWVDSQPGKGANFSFTLPARGA